METTRMNWSFSNHPISDLRDWANAGLLELRPDFQRREVWSQAARIMLIDSILRNFPMPKIYLQAEIKSDNRTYRAVIDGQQRLSAILDFLRDEFSLAAPCTNQFIGRRFSQLNPATRKLVLGYKVDVNEIFDENEKTLREMYGRVNKYTKQLNRQELRRADFPGRFLDLSEDLVLDDYLESAGVFSVGDRRRMGDTEFVSELLAGLLRGPQDKKTTLDTLYQKYAKWRKAEQDATTKRFYAVISDLKTCFDKNLPISQTRFRQKADFYSLFLAIDGLLMDGHSAQGRSLDDLRKDLTILDQHIAPTSPIAPLSEYAVKCVSDANSAASRAWRLDFLTGFLRGTYVGEIPTGTAELRMRQILVALRDLKPEAGDGCPLCGEALSDIMVDSVWLAWPKNTRVFQVSNARLAHVSCPKKRHLGAWMVAKPS